MVSKSAVVSSARYFILAGCSGRLLPMRGHILRSPGTVCVPRRGLGCCVYWKAGWFVARLSPEENDEGCGESGGEPEGESGFPSVLIVNEGKAKEVESISSDISIPPRPALGSENVDPYVTKATRTCAILGTAEPACGDERVIGRRLHIPDVYTPPIAPDPRHDA
jgi:hypothetical protein